MDSRLRRFLSTRSRSPDLSNKSPDIISVAYEQADQSARQPIFLLQPGLLKHAPTRRSGRHETPLKVQAFSYDQLAAGKAPKVGGAPIKGNGPIKLATSRRLETGELEITCESPTKALKTAQQGDYEIGRKERPASTQPSKHSSASVQPSSSRTSTAPTSVSRKMSTSSSVPSLARSSDFDASNSPSPRSFSARHDDDHRSTKSFNSALLTPTSAQSSSDQNSTLKALRRAEYDRLVATYGQDDADQNIARMEREHMLNSSGPSSPLATGHPHHLIEVSSQPVQKTISNNGDDWSDMSSVRQSRLSSYADSTRMFSAHFSDEDLPATKEDIRRMIEQMRTTYLNAIEQHAPRSKRISVKRRSRNTKPSVKKPKAKPGVDQASSVAVPDRQTWPRPAEPSTPTDRRLTSDVSGGLSPIAASPKTEMDKPGLTRCDSTTLGRMAASIRNTENDDLPEVDLDLVPAGAYGRKYSTATDVNVDDFDAIYDEVYQSVQSHAAAASSAPLQHHYAPSVSSIYSDHESVLDLAYPIVSSHN